MLGAGSLSVAITTTRVIGEPMIRVSNFATSAFAKELIALTVGSQGSTKPTIGIRRPTVNIPMPAGTCRYGIAEVGATTWSARAVVQQMTAASSMPAPGRRPSGTHIGSHVDTKADCSNRPHCDTCRRLKQPPGTISSSSWPLPQYHWQYMTRHLSSLHHRWSRLQLPLPMAPPSTQGKLPAWSQIRQSLQATSLQALLDLTSRQRVSAAPRIR